MMTRHPWNPPSTQPPTPAPLSPCPGCAPIRSTDLDLVLTGATGFLGHYLLAELCRRGPHRFRLLLRPPLADSRRRLSRLLSDLGLDLNALIATGRVRLFEGELPRVDDPALMRGADAVIHAAANINFDATTDGEPMRTNLDGTWALLDAAASAGVGHFVFVSTAFVCGRRTGNIREAFLSKPSGPCNDYERSKRRAEQAVRRWGTGSRVATICRPTILFGDRATGRATRFAGIYVIMRATEMLSRAVLDDASVHRHHIPFRILVQADATCNLVPVDWVASRIAQVVLDRSLHGRMHHVTNPEPPSYAQIKRWLEEYFDIGGGVFCDEPWPLENPNHYEELVYAFGNVVKDYFRPALRFESRWADQQRPVPPLVDRDAFRRAMAYAQAAKWNASRSLKVERPRRQNGKRINLRWYFETFLPRMVPRSSIARIEALTTTVRFCFTDPAEEWVCRFDGGRLVRVQRGANTLVEEFGYRVTRDAFAQMVTAREPLQEAFFRGDAQIFGNTERALRMVPMMTAFIQEYTIEYRDS